MRPPLHLISPLLLFALHSAFSQTEPTPLFQLNLRDLPVGVVTSEALKETGRASNALTPAVFQFRAQEPNPTANIVELEGKIKALRINAPALPAGSGHPVPIALYLDDKSLSSQIDPAKPLHLEIQFQRKGVPIHFSVTAYFRAEGAGYVPIVQAGLGVLSPTGIYEAIKTPVKPNPEREEGPDLPNDQPMTLKFELAPNSSGLTVKTELLAGGGAIFETQEPATIPGGKLGEFCGLCLMVAHFPNLNDTGEDAIDVISLKAWQ